MEQKTVSLQLTPNEAKNIKNILTEKGWKEEYVDNEYVGLRMKSDSGSVCTVYTSMKVVFQGKEDFAEMVKQIKEILSTKLTPHLGVDEVGKGDYFGPLVVVACFVNANFLSKVSSLGIADSKKFSDSSIRRIYAEIKDYGEYYVSMVSPEEYNRDYTKIKNVSILLAKQHSKVIEMGLEDLKKKGIECKQVVIDQFSSKKSRVVDELGPLGKGIEFIQFHKGESDVAVASASILARGIFLEEKDRMNKEYYFDFPKGASNVIPQAKEFVKTHGSKELNKVAKISFKTTAKVLQSSF
jgi:ribonuclease HIII